MVRVAGSSSVRWRMASLASRTAVPRIGKRRSGVSRGVMPCNRRDRDGAGYFAGRMTAHAVGNSEEPPPGVTRILVGGPNQPSVRSGRGCRELGHAWPISVWPGRLGRIRLAQGPGLFRSGQPGSRRRSLQPVCGTCQTAPRGQSPAPTSTPDLQLCRFVPGGLPRTVELDPLKRPVTSAFDAIEPGTRRGVLLSDLRNFPDDIRMNP